MSDETSSVTSIDPRERFAKPPFPQEKQSLPGSGETSYQGHGRLEGCEALVTGADSGIGPAVTSCFAKEGVDILLVPLPEEKDDAAKTVFRSETSRSSWSG